MKKKNNNTITILLIIIIFCILGIIVYLLIKNNNKKDNNICINKSEYYKLLLEQNNLSCKPCKHSKDLPKDLPKDLHENKKEIIEIIQDITPVRDIQVLDNPLYPALNRTDRQTLNTVAYQTDNRNFNIPTQDIGDSYHLVGYITSTDQSNIDKGGNSWKLMGRKYNRNQADFYIIPTNNNYDLKIPLTQDIIIGQRLNDIYTIPTELKFNSPFLNKSLYTFVELPKTNFDSNRYY